MTNEPVDWMSFIKQGTAKPEYDGRVLITKADYEAIQADAIQSFVAANYQKLNAETIRVLEKIHGFLKIPEHGEWNASLAREALTTHLQKLKGGV